MRGGQNSSSRPPPSGGVAAGIPQRVLTAKDIKVIMNNPLDAKEKPEILTRKDSKMGRKDKLQLSEKEAVSQMTKSKFYPREIGSIYFNCYFSLAGVDVFDAKAVVSMDVCVRSNSVDSLRTTGHSRSVSHDSYFDLLQSPLRGIVNCPSRELSELGMNFDREEPEMRLFSESESLVSSPRIPKEHQTNGGGLNNGTTGHASRRVLRSRPDEFSNATSSINPSPKKQPRLNIQGTAAASATAASDMAGWGPMSMDESIMCKRYKLEDQLSDIQFIDCNTPEHQIGVANPTTAFSSTSSLSNSLNAMTKFNTNAQVHEPPTIVVKKAKDTSQATQGLKSPLNRFSYPQYVNQNQNDTQVQIRTNDSSKKASDTERFSYPGERRRENKRYGYQEDQDDQSDSLVKSVMDHFNFAHNNPATADTLEPPKGLSTDPSQQSLQTIITPSSPSHSLRYSLLSSENHSESGSVGNLLTSGLGGNLMETSVTSATKLMGRSGPSAVGSNQMTMSMEDEMVDEHTRDTNNEGDVIHDVDLEKTFVDISALKRKFSLDLLAESPPGRSDIDKAQKILNLSTPNTPNVTQNSGGATTTSQSVTPSEFGYQHLNRLSNIGTPATPNEVIPGSPIKSTICITYNTKSPTSTPPRSRGEPVLKSSDNDTSEDYEVIEVETKELSPLQAAYDENMVYEQVRFFKNAVSAINDLVEGGAGNSADGPDSGEVTPKAIKEATTIAVQIVPERTAPAAGTTLAQNDADEALMLRVTKNEGSCDVSMTSAEVPFDHLEDSLEFDNNLSLYENVIVERPAAFYENVEVRKSMGMRKPEQKALPLTDLIVDVKVIQPSEVEGAGEDERPKGKFLVKQLATKFETSPVDPQPPFDFGKGAAGLLLRRDASSGAVNRPEVDRNRMTVPASGPGVITKSGSSPRAIAKSLDENAFVREFGSVKILDKFPNLEAQQENNQNSENINGTRRSGGSDYAKPKSLNPPKKLPLLEGAATNVTPVSIVESCKAAIRSKEDPMSKSSPYLAQRITPTTENRISLVQNNDGVKTVTDEVDDKSAGGGAVQLRDCKLDRERIERIKEERRLQLNEKFRSESFKGENDTIKMKSKSKTELRASEKGDAIIHASSTLDRTTLRSKSKVDIAREKDEEKLKRFSGNNRSEEQLSWIGGGGGADRRSLLIQDRIRRVSENKGAVGTAAVGDEVRDATTTNANWKLRNKFEKRNSSGNGLVAAAGRERDGGTVESIIQRNMEQQ